MVLKIFKGTGPGVIVIIALAFLAVWFSAFFNPAEQIHYSSGGYHMPLYSLLLKILGPGYLPSAFLSFSLAAAMLFLITNFNTTLFFINERTFLPSFIYIMLIAVFPEYQLLNPAIPASLIFMIALNRTMAGYHKQGIPYNFFDAGILIGAGSLFYATLLWFGLVIIIGIILLRSVNISELALSLLGLLTPYLIMFGLYYILGYSLEELLSLIYNNLFAEAEGYFFPRLTIVTLIIVALITLISIGYILMVQNSKKIKTRKTFSLLIWLFIVTITLYFALPSVSIEMIWLTGIPASYFLSHYFIYSRKKVVSEIFFSVILVLVLLIQSLYSFL